MLNRENNYYLLYKTQQVIMAIQRKFIISRKKSQKAVRATAAD